MVHHLIASISIINNFLTGCNSGNYLLQNSIVSENGISIIKGGADGTGVEHITISNNHIESSHGAGVYIEEARYCMISNNRFFQNWCEGVRISGGSDFMITKNHFDDNGLANVGILKAGIVFAGFGENWYSPYRGPWSNVFITSNQFTKKYYQNYSIYLSAREKITLHFNLT